MEESGNILAPMDSELASELEHVMGIEDREGCRMGTGRLLRYIMTLQLVPDEYAPLLQRFVCHAFEVMPSSNLPMLTAQKFGLPVSRRRKVSFGEAVVCAIEDRSPAYSREGERQRIREDGSLSITNTDPHRKFRPKNCVEKGLPFQTKIIPLLDLSLRNAWGRPLCMSGKGIPKPDLGVDDVIANPSILDMYK